MNISSATEELSIVIPLLCKFVYTNRLADNINKLAEGEFYTLLRRHSKHSLFNPHRSISCKNIQINVYNGVIQHIEFMSAYGSSYAKDKMKMYNDCLYNLNPNYPELAFKSSISSVVDNIEKYNLNFK